MEETEKIVVTQEDLDENPALVDAGVEVGDEGQVVTEEAVDLTVENPAEVTQEGDPVSAPLQADES